MKKVGAFFLVLFIAVQVYRPEKNNGSPINGMDFLTAENVPPPIADIFQKSCYNCHSNHTDYAWYDNIVPFAWYIDRKIKRAKRSLNFSKWGAFEPWQRRLFLQGGIVYDIDTKRMPPKSYLALHPEAVISEQEKEAIAAWIATVDMMKE